MKGKTFLVVGLLILLIGVGGVAAYLYRQVAALKENPSAVAQKEVTTLVERVGKLILLPSGEQPTVATVSDVEKLRDQQFFSNAKNGDKVLI